MAGLSKEIRMLQNPVALLAGANALLNATSAVLMVAGRRFIRRGDRDRHMRWMLAAAVLQGVFLILYVVRIGLYGTTPFEGPGPLRAAYLVLLGSHMFLAMVAAPLVVLTLWWALRGDWVCHRRLARWTYPVWLYVSVTGPLVFAMLYGFGRPGA